VKIFDYQCSVCNHVFEEMFNDTEPRPEVLECPKCKTNAAVKVKVYATPFTNSTDGRGSYRVG